MNEIVSIFTVTDLKTKEQFQEAITGDGQSAISFLRKQYSPFTRFVLEGFEINGKFKKLYIDDSRQR